MVRKRGKKTKDQRNKLELFFAQPAGPPNPFNKRKYFQLNKEHPHFFPNGCLSSLATVWRWEEDILTSKKHFINKRVKTQIGGPHRASPQAGWSWSGYFLVFLFFPFSLEGFSKKILCSEKIQSRSVGTLCSANNHKTGAVAARTPQETSTLFVPFFLMSVGQYAWLFCLRVGAPPYHQLCEYAFEGPST